MISNGDYVLLWILAVVSNLIWIGMYISQRRETLRYFNALKKSTGESDEQQAPSYDPEELHW